MTSTRRFGAVAASLLIALVVVVVVWPVAAQEGLAAADGPVYGIQAFDGRSPHVIPAAAFSSDGTSPDSLFMWFAGGYMQGSATGYGCVKAPAYLPQGAKLTDLFVSMYDNDATLDMTATLWRVDNFDGSTDIMAEVTSSGAYAGIQVLNDYPIDQPIVNYPGYSYYATTCLVSADIRLYSVRIYYDQYYTFLPVVLRNYP